MPLPHSEPGEKFPADLLARKAEWRENRGMNKTVLTVVLLLGVGGYFGWGYMGSRANDTALETASVAENRVSLAITGMT